MTEITYLTEEEFYTKFNPQKNHNDANAGFDGCMFETYGEELDYVWELSKKKCVVTIIEGDDDSENIFIDSNGTKIIEPNPNMYYVSGFNLVNRMGYFVLDEPYQFEFIVKIE
jgi:5-methylthioribose kinase